MTKEYTKNAWMDMSFEGQKMRSIFKQLNTKVNKIMNLIDVAAIKFDDESGEEETNTNKLLPMALSMVDTMNKCARTNMKLLEITDQSKRVEDLERLLKIIPPDVLRQAQLSLLKAGDGR